MIEETTPNFYNEHGQVADPAKAQEIANLEKPARDRELSLNKEHVEGLTEEQKKNIEIMDGVEKKYPNAFETIEHDSGKVLWGKKPGGGSVILSKEGVFGIFGESVAEGLEAGKIDEQKLAKIVNNPKDMRGAQKFEDIHYGDWRDLRGETGVIPGAIEATSFEKKDVMKKGFDQGKYRAFGMARYDLTRETGREEVRKMLVKAEDFGRKEKERTRVIEISTEDILADL